MPNVVLENQVLIGEENYIWADFAKSDLSNPSNSSTDSPVAFIVDDAESSFKILMQMRRKKLDGMIILRSRMTVTVKKMLEKNEYSIFDSKTRKWEYLTKSEKFPNRISLLTSGTTGTPKLLHHTWDSINTSSSLKRLEPRNWLLPYQIGTYAWFQLVTLSMFSKNQNITICEDTDLVKIFRLAYLHRVDAISATPTFWRMALMQVPIEILSSFEFKQITLGGEIVDQNILDSLQAMYPTSRITHIYASTEAGASIVVNDGKSGFPESLLSTNGETVSLKIEDGVLFIRSKFAAMNSHDGGGWVNTRDRVECESGRIFIKGRADSSLINVGGSKAYPSDIEAVILSHESVDWCRVRAVKAPFLGNLPQADLKLNTSMELDEVERIMISFCSERLPEYAVPRVWNLLDKIPISENLKAEL